MNIRDGKAMEGDGGYDRERFLVIGGCALIKMNVMYTSEESAELAKLAGLSKSGYFVAMQPAKRLGFGVMLATEKSLRDLEALGVEPGKEVADQIERARKAGLSSGAVKWLDSYRRTIATDVAFSYITGISAQTFTVSRPPTTGSCLAACSVMFESVPELQGKLDEVKALDEGWGAVVAAWAPLMYLLQSECPEWRSLSLGSKSPKTDCAIKSILKQAGRTDLFEYEVDEDDEDCEAGWITFIEPRLLAPDDVLHFIEVDGVRGVWIDTDGMSSEIRPGIEVTYRKKRLQMFGPEDESLIDCPRFKILGVTGRSKEQSSLR